MSGTLAVMGSPTRLEQQFFCWLAIFCVAIPGQQVEKAVLLIGFWGYLVLAKSFSRDAVIWLLSVMLNLLACAAIGLCHDVPSADVASESTRILIFFLVLGLGAWFFEPQAAAKIDLDRLIRIILFLMALAKVAFLVLVLTGVFTFPQIADAVGFESVSLDIGMGLQRMQFPSDIVVIFLLGCYRGGRNRWLDALLLLATTIVVFVSFSRFIFGGFVICMVMRAAWIRRMDFVSWIFVTIAVCVLVIFSDSIALRFTSDQSVDSDAIRAEEIRVLSDAFKDHPILGTGLGASVPGYIRSESLVYQYELQWYAMAMQMGIVGLAWLIMNVALFVIYQFQRRRNVIFLVCVLGMWVGSAFTNPYLTSLGCAFGLCLLLIRCNSAAAEQSAVRHAPSRVGRLAAPPTP